MTICHATHVYLGIYHRALIYKTIYYVIHIYLAFYVTYASYAKFEIFLTENYWISHQEILSWKCRNHN